MHYTHTQTHPHLCIISGTSSHLFTANLHLPLNSLAAAAHHSDTVMVHIHLRVPQAVLSVFSSPIELWPSLSHYVQPPIALRFSYECAHLTNSFLNWIRCRSYSLRPCSVTNCSSERGSLKMLMYVVRG